MIGDIKIRTALVAFGGVFVGATAGWLARGAVADLFQIPQVISHQEQLCTERVERVAAEAVAAEQLRQFRIAERATQWFYAESKEAADDATALRTVLEMEIQNYEQQLDITAGTYCVLDAAALQLLGVQPRQ